MLADKLWANLTLDLRPSNKKDSSTVHFYSLFVIKQVWIMLPR